MENTCLQLLAEISLHLHIISKKTIDALFSFLLFRKYKKKIRRTPKNMGCNWQISIFEFFTNIMDNFSTFFFQKHKGKSAYLKC